MHRYLMRRAAFGVLTIFGVSIIIFVVMRLLPGDLLAVMYGEGATKLSDADRAKIRQYVEKVQEGVPEPVGEPSESAPAPRSVVGRSRK